MDDEAFYNTPEERAELEKLVALGIDITRPLEEQSPEVRAAYDHYLVSKQRGFVPECRHRCPACRMGLVTHLICDPQCELHTRGGI